MLCCDRCFDDEFIKLEVVSNQERIGKCSFCDANDVPLVNTESLSDLFQPVIELYQVSKGGEGKKLVKLIQSDWKIFSLKLTDERKESLLDAIIGDGTYTKNMFESKYNNESVILSWENFKEELQHRNRFFPKKVVDIEQIKSLLDYLILHVRPKHIYRARILRDKNKYQIHDMGKPPNEKTVDGRANPKGIAYFYGASDEETAISELRPYKSEKVAVCKFKMNISANLVDFRNPKDSISPFFLDEDDLKLFYEKDFPFLDHLSKTLAKPVLPYQKALEYLPTQYLCELIKDKGFDGIVFKSSLGKGDNYVIFNDDILEGEVIEYYQVDGINFHVEKLD